MRVVGWGGELLLLLVAGREIAGLPRCGSVGPGEKAGDWRGSAWNWNWRRFNQISLSFEGS
jgi:hypothetical protein